MPLIINKNINWNSPKQVLEIFTRYGINLTDTKFETISQVDHPLAKLLTEYRERQKRISTYGHNWKQYVYNGRVYAQWHQNFTATGRLSCVAKGTLIEVIRDVSKYPKGIPIEDVKIGDLVYTFNDDLDLKIKPVTNVVYNGIKPVIRLHWVGTGKHTKGYLDVTSDHLIRTTDGKYVRADRLKCGSRILSISRNVCKSYGYARMWATGYEEICREHRFIFQEIYGWLPNVVHHKDGNKLNNHPKNLLSTTREDHMYYHPASEDLCNKRSVITKQRIANGWHPPIKKGKECHNYLNLTKEWMEQVLHENKGKPTAFRDVYGIDYDTAQKYMRLHGIDWKEIRRQYGKIHNHEIVRIEYTNKSIEVYDLEVKDTHNFIAGELCVHNCSSPNVQNQPRLKQYRECFEAPAGKKLVVADYSMIEVRIAAKLANEQRLIEAFKRGDDIHSLTAAIVLEKDVSQVTKAERQIGKSCVFCLQYGGGADKLRRYAQAQFKTHISLEEATEYKKRFMSAYPGLTKWHRSIPQDPINTRTLAGRHRLQVDKFTEKVNSPDQGSGADMMKLALALLWERRAECPASFPIMAVHDELVIEAAEYEAEKAKEWVTKAMLDAAEWLLHPVPVSVEATICNNWSEKS